MKTNSTQRTGGSIMKKLPILVGAVVLSGGVFLTAQGLTNDSGPLPSKTAPLVVNATPQQASPTTTSQRTADRAACRDDDGSFDDNGNDACKRMVTVMPTPHVLGDDHGRDDNGRHGRDDSAGDDNGTGEDRHGDRVGGGDDDAPGTADRHGGRSGVDDNGSGRR